jgi:hypothetical protein
VVGSAGGAGYSRMVGRGIWRASGSGAAGPARSGGHARHHAPSYRYHHAPGSRHQTMQARGTNPRPTRAGVRRHAQDYGAAKSPRAPARRVAARTPFSHSRTFPQKAIIATATYLSPCDSHTTHTGHCTLAHTIKTEISHFRNSLLFVVILPCDYLAAKGPGNARKHGTLPGHSGSAGS